MSARNTKRFVVVFFLNFLLFIYFTFGFIFFFLRIFNRSAATCGGGYRRCSSCVLIDAYKVLECGQHLNQSMVPLMLNARDRFAFRQYKSTISPRETTLSLDVASSAYLAFLALLSITFSISLFLPSFLSLCSFTRPTLAFPFPLCVVRS